MKKKFLQLSISALLLTTALTTKEQSWSLIGNSNTKTNTNFLGTTNNKALVIRTNNIEQMRINSNGKVGIGTVNPLAKLNIAGGSKMYSLSNDGYFMLGYDSINNMAFDYQQIQARYNGQGAALFLNHLGGPVSIGSYNGAVFPAIWTNADGRVGIGTNYALALNYAITVEPNLSGNGMYINDPGNGYSLYTVKSGSTGAAVHVEAKSTYTAAIEAFTHNAQRAIYGEDLLNGNGVEGRSSGGNAVVGVSALNVGILGVAPAYAGYFDGDVYASGTYVGSDQKLKQNINDFSSAMDIINQLYPKHYEYRHDGNYKLMNLPKGEHYGLIAQDVEKVLPDLIKDTKFETRYAKPNTADKENSETIDFKALNYVELIPIIIKGMQEQQAVNDKQQQQIREQQQQIDELKKMLQTALGNQSSSVKSSATDNSGAYLQQNTPNPFSQNTVIHYYVPSSVKQARLAVYSSNGKFLKSYALSGNDMNEVTISSGELSSGDYVYALLIDGKKIDSKHMILTK